MNYCQHVYHQGFACGFSGEGLLRHDEVEVIEANLLAVAGGTLEHFLEFIRTHGLAELLGHAAEVVNVDGSRAVVVEQIEDASDSVFRLLVAQFSGYRIEEVVEVDARRILRSVQVGNHLEDDGVLIFEAEAVHGSFQLCRVDQARAIGVKQVECFANLLNLVFSQAGSLEGFSADRRLLVPAKRCSGVLGHFYKI